MDPPTITSSRNARSLPFRPRKGARLATIILAACGGTFLVLYQAVLWLDSSPVSTTQYLENPNTSEASFGVRFCLVYLIGIFAEPYIIS